MSDLIVYALVTPALILSVGFILYMFYRDITNV